MTQPPEVQAVIDAWTDAGPVPRRHFEEISRLQQRWPTLAFAIRRLVQAQNRVVPAGPSAQQAADELYPPNHPVDDPHGDTGEAQSDPYGYDELGNRAFMEGATWQAQQQADRVIKLLADRYIVRESAGPYRLYYSQQEIEATIREAFKQAVS